MTTKLADSKGRIALGKAYAGAMVIVDDTDPFQIILKPAVAVPASEAWLYNNEKALTLVRTGLKQAKEGKFSKNPPDIEADKILAETMVD
jgi:hypothetical protein